MNQPDETLASTVASTAAAPIPAASRSGRPVGLQLLMLSGPVIATNISRTVMGMADFVMVSQLGRDAQAALMPAALVLWTVVGFGFGMVAVVNTFVSQSLGRNHHDDCSTYGWHGVYISLVVGVVAAPTWFLVPMFFGLANHGPAIIPMEIAYTRIGLLGVGPTVAAAALSSFFTGVHRPSVCLVTALISNLFNVVANFALIFGYWGFPALGIAGAAWATLAASLLHCLLLLAWFVFPYYRSHFGSGRTWRLSLTHLKDLVHIGWLPGLLFAGDIGAWTIFAIFLVGQFGEVHLAASNICFKIIEFSFMPAVGMGHAVTAAVGKAIGEGRLDLMRRYVRWGLAYCVGYMGLIGLIMAVFRHELAGLLTDDPEVIRWAGYLMIMCAIFQVFDALTVTFSGVLRGAGDTHWQSIVCLSSLLGILLGGGYLISYLRPQWAGAGVWVAATLHVCVVGCVLGLRYRSGAWAKRDLFVEKEESTVNSRQSTVRKEDGTRKAEGRRKTVESREARGGRDGRNDQ